MKTLDETRNFILEYLGRVKDFNATQEELGLDGYDITIFMIMLNQFPLINDKKPATPEALLKTFQKHLHAWETCTLSYARWYARVLLNVIRYMNS